MERTIRWMVALLVLQLGLAAWLMLGRDSAAVVGDEPLLALDLGQVDRITIADAETAGVSLRRVDGRWVLSQPQDFPADADKVRRVLERLTALSRGAPVATSAGALTRFKVSEEDFERRVEFAAGDRTLATLYVGTSPGLRRVHARRAQDEAVYAVDFSVHDVPPQAADWEDKDLLRLARNDIAAIEIDGMRLERKAAARADIAPDDATGDGSAATAAATWHVEGLAEDEALNAAEADRLAGLIADLRIGSVFNGEADAEVARREPALSLALHRQDGQRIDYRLAKLPDDTAYVLYVSHRPEQFRLPGYVVEPIVQAAQRERLVARADATSDTSDTSDANEAEDAAQSLRPEQTSPRDPS